jgi:hypothetical protein
MTADGLTAGSAVELHSKPILPSSIPSFSDPVICLPVAVESDQKGTVRY